MGTSIQMIITRLHSRAHPSFIPAHNACVFGMETPLRGRSGGHTGTAPTVSLGWIACKWLFCLCGIAWKNMMEFGRGGACVPARVALSRAHPSLSSPRTMCVFLVWKRRCADVRAGTQAPPLPFQTHIAVPQR